MLTAIRTNFSKGFARWILIILVAVLVASFGIWGIQDVFRGFRSDEVVSVGSTHVSAEAYQRAYRLEVQQASRRYGKVLSPTEARLLGLDQQVLARVTGNATLDEQAKSYGLGLDEPSLAATVLDDPSFRPNGAPQFDRNYFNAVLRENGMTEAGFFAEQRRVYLRGQIADAITGELAAPRVLREAFARYGSETRGVAYVTLTQDSLGNVGQPDEAALSSFFEEHKSDFRKPEYRKVTYLSVTPDDLAAKAVVTDDDAKADYDSRKDRFTTPEKRTIQQIAFQDPNEAKAAADKIASGAATFDSLAAERKLSPADLELGTFTRPQLLDPAIANAAFALAENKPSGAIQGQFTTVILRVTKIEPQVVTPFDQVKDQIKKEIATDRARKDLLDIQAKVEDERSGGAPLKEIAGKLGLQTVEVAAVDSRGEDTDGKAVTLPQQDKLLPAIFAADPGSDTDAIDGRDAGIVWYAVDSVTPARDRTLEEAHADVVTAWTADEKAKRLKEKADEMLTALRGGQSLEDAAKAAKLEVKQAWNLKRNAAAQGLSTAAVNQAFSTPVKSFATALADNGTDRVVLQVTDSTVPPYDPANAQTVAFDKQLDQSLTQDVLIEYVARLQKDLGLSVNAAAIGRILGIGGEG